MRVLVDIESWQLRGSDEIRVIYWPTARVDYGSHAERLVNGRWTWGVFNVRRKRIPLQVLEIQ